MLDLDNNPLSRGRTRQAAGWLARVAVDNAGGAVYGTVMVGVLLAAEDTHREGYPETIGAAAVVLALYWLMSLYTHTLGIRLRTRGRLNRKLLWHSCAYELAIVEGAFVPVLALLIAWAAGATVTSGVTVALWATVLSVVILEVAAAWRARLRPQEVGRRWRGHGVGDHCLEADPPLTEAPRHSFGRAAGESSATADLALLRTYEPIIRYTRGELFFPTAVGPYVAHCSLWDRADTGASTLIVPAPTLTLERLSEESIGHPDRRLYLRFVEKPLGRQEYRRWRRSSRGRLSAASRFTTTGVLGRLIDAGFRASLLLRGRVPSGLAAAAERAYRQHLEADRFTYYGRVIRDGGYVCLQYWFFYAMNDWRSTFHGVNDHEADWEMITVYLAENQDGLRPVWAAFSSHDYFGDDLRRRWDDPEFHVEGDHPGVFAGAGSHAGAFIPGDYVVSVDPPQLRAIISFLRRARHPARRGPSPHGDDGFGIPFVDYARGDGVAIGPGQEVTWNAILINDETPWVRAYRGLWGLDTRDRFGGERAPAGPRYERDGSVRSSWVNPLGWAGLLKISPDDAEVTDLLTEHVGKLERELGELDADIEAERSALRSLRVEARSLEQHDYGPSQAAGRRGKLAEREAALNQMIATRTRIAEERRVHLVTLSRPFPADPPEAHLSKPHRPHGSDQQRRTRFLELWAVISVPLLLSSIAVALTASPLALATTMLIFAGVFMGMEAIARRRFVSFLANLLLLLAGIGLSAALVFLFLAHWRLAVSVLIGVAALMLLLGNLLRR